MKQFDLILVSMKHGTLDQALSTLKENNVAGDVVFFNGLWKDYSSVDAYLARDRYLWGYPVAGGNVDYAKARLEGAILDNVLLAEIDGRKTERYKGSLACSRAPESKWSPQRTSCTGSGSTWRSMRCHQHMSEVRKRPRLHGRHEGAQRRHSHHEGDPQSCRCERSTSTNAKMKCAPTTCQFFSQASCSNGFSGRTFSRAE